MRLLKFILYAFYSVFTFRELANNLYSFTEQLYHKRRASRIVGDGLITVDIGQFFTSESIRNYTYLDGTSSPMDICLLKSLAKSLPNCRYLEIGTWRGESFFNVVDVDGVRARGVSKEININKTDDNVRLVWRITEGLSAEVLPIFGDIFHKFDLIFIDGSHEYADIVTDTRNAFKLLRDDNSVIVWHDYGVTTEKVNWMTLDAILKGTPKDKLCNLYHVSNTLCAIYTKRELKGVDGMNLFKVSIDKQ